METLFALGILTISPPAFAAVDYICNSFAGWQYRHYEFAVDTKAKKAYIDTIGTRSPLKLVKVGYLESNPPQKLYRFAGPFNGMRDGDWDVAFNATKETVDVSFIRVTGEVVDVGQSTCRAVE